ncbi:MAG: hypothetical protein LUD17_04385 [Bacteroidales bacterium]|nr:hypothetical protein [Bacteroidales bacterium]
MNPVNKGIENCLSCEGTEGRIIAWWFAVQGLFLGATTLEWAILILACLVPLWSAYHEESKAGRIATAILYVLDLAFCSVGVVFLVSMAPIYVYLVMLNILLSARGLVLLWQRDKISFQIRSPQVRKKNIGIVLNTMVAFYYLLVTAPQMYYCWRIINNGEELARDHGLYLCMALTSVLTMAILVVHIFFHKERIINYLAVYLCGVSGIFYYLNGPFSQNYGFEIAYFLMDGVNYCLPLYLCYAWFDDREKVVTVD